MLNLSKHTKTKPKLKQQLTVKTAYMCV